MTEYNHYLKNWRVSIIFQTEISKRNKKNSWFYSLIQKIRFQIFWHCKTFNKIVGSMIMNLFGIINVIFHFRCWKMPCVQHWYWSILTCQSHTPCTLTLANMAGQVYSPKKHTSIVNGKEITMDNPVSYVSGLLRGRQINWAALTKEAHTIYMPVKKSTFYITYHEIMLRSNHLPLKKFLRKMTLNDTSEQLVY